MAVCVWNPELDQITAAQGLTFLMHRDDSAQCQMHNVGVPEAAIINWAKEQFGDKTKTFVDGGAHMGVYSVMLSDSFKEVHSFEAQRRTYLQLCGNIFLNEKENVRPYNVAITSPPKANEITTLSIVSQDGGGSTICPPHVPVLATEKVSTKTIDSYRIENVGLIKLDIEGNELNALKGARSTIERSNKPPIIFEANNDAWYAEQKKELFSYLNGTGYDVIEIRPFDNMFVAIERPELLDQSLPQRT
jgi:FkbM family methyltransferase